MSLPLTEVQQNWQTLARMGFHRGQKATWYLLGKDGAPNCTLYIDTKTGQWCAATSYANARFDDVVAAAVWLKTETGA